MTLGLKFLPRTIYDIDIEPAGVLFCYGDSSRNFPNPRLSFTNLTSIAGTIPSIQTEFRKKNPHRKPIVSLAVEYYFLHKYING